MITTEQKIKDLLDIIEVQISDNLCKDAVFDRIRYMRVKLPQTHSECAFNEFTSETKENIYDVLDFIEIFGEYFDNTYIIDLLQLLCINWHIKHDDGYWYGEIFESQLAIPKGNTYNEALNKIVHEQLKFWRAML